MQRYSIPFKDYKNNSYDVKIYIDGYVGAVTELTGARNTFVVTGNDSDFVYEPLRTSTATLTIIDSNLLLDLFSINNQYAPVKLYKGNKLMWTGYIVPEQFTQPYKPTLDSISIDCVSAMGTLENIKYEQQTETGFITAMDLLRYLVKSANGGYEKVYIPHVYASSSANYVAKRNVFDEIELAEENFTSEEMMLDEVMEHFCRFFSWVMYDQEGSLYFVDPDWDGEYYAYNEGFTSYALVSPNRVLLQDIGFAGSDHTIDVLQGYNKATVKAVNNVFDNLIYNEDFEALKRIGIYGKYDAYLIAQLYEGKLFATRKLFYKPDIWILNTYDQKGTPLEISEVDAMTSEDINNNILGAVLMKEAQYTIKKIDGGFEPTDDITDYNYTNSVQIRVKSLEKKNNPFIGTLTPALVMKGVNASFQQGAISFSCSLRSGEDEYMSMYKTNGWPSTPELTCSARIGKRYWTGSAWVQNKSTFPVLFTKNGDTADIVNTKKADMPYSGLNGYIIVLPDNEIINGDFEFTIYAPQWNNMYGVILRNLSFNYKKKDNVVDEGEDGDRIYENVINEKYMSELDEIEFGISSYNADGATYSKALMNGNFLTDNLYSVIEDKLVRPEEALIRRIVNRYQVTKIKLTQVIKNSDEIHPFTILSDNSMKIKKFMMLGGVWDYEDNSIQLAMTENGERG